jgi:hypothetical protein
MNKPKDTMTGTVKEVVDEVIAILYTQCQEHVNQWKDSWWYFMGIMLSQLIAFM